MLRTVRATRYVTPLREGGSLPAVIEADDDGTYVLKFRGAGQGPRALVAELIVGEIARSLGLPVPEIVFVDLDPTIARSEPDSEIQHLVKSSAGINLALDFLPGAFAYDPLVGPHPDAGLASAIVWLDALTMNVDRTARNTNMLVWHKRLWLIDHGAALYFHHAWRGDADYLARASDRFAAIKDHVLLPRATDLLATSDRLRNALADETSRAIVDLVPDEWLAGMPGFADLEAVRSAYGEFLRARRDAATTFVEEAERARAQLV